MEKINFIIVFLEGVLSFLSPCVIPILPIYLAILSNSRNDKNINHQKKRNKRVLLTNTLLFVFGISTTFFLLGTGIGIFRTFLTEYKRYLLIGGGIFIILMGLFYVGDIKIPFLQKEKRIQLKTKQMNPIIAYLLGLTFSFGWTPCIGPMLASVLVLASTNRNVLTGNLLIGVYTLGFIIPFLIVAAFSDNMLKLLDKVKLKSAKLKTFGGYIILLMGLLVLINGITTPKFIRPAYSQGSNSTGESGVIMAPDFTLVDQYGTIHTLSDYKGKTVFLNFWATWCPPCKREMPHIEDIYKEYGSNEEDVIILGVAFPNEGGEKSKQGIIEFLEDKNYTFPVVFDESSNLSYYYNISVYPTTFIINPEGGIEGYLQGAMRKDDMRSIIDQVKDKSER
nr:cytochrome c biogenesis protein/redoxin [uncultured Lachnoclostridium sp.]